MQTLSLVENGAKVIIVSRNADKLKDVAKKYGGDGQARGEILTVSGDITSKEGVQAIVKEVQGLVSGGINIL
jgi:NAD(P)-dependent dehydrogenase (short-subunit alcohol dehydrogenase family)